MILEQLLARKAIQSALYAIAETGVDPTSFVEFVQSADASQPVTRPLMYGTDVDSGEVLTPGKPLGIVLDKLNEFMSNAVDDIQIIRQALYQLLTGLVILRWMSRASQVRQYLTVISAQEAEWLGSVKPLVELELVASKLTITPAISQNGSVEGGYAPNSSFEFEVTDTAPFYVRIDVERTNTEAGTVKVQTASGGYRVLYGYVDSAGKDRRLGTFNTSTDTFYVPAPTGVSRIWIRLESDGRPLKILGVWLAKAFTHVYEAVLAVPEDRLATAPFSLKVDGTVAGDAYAEILVSDDGVSFTPAGKLTSAGFVEEPFSASQSPTYVSFSSADTTNGLFAATNPGASEPPILLVGEKDTAATFPTGRDTEGYAAVWLPDSTQLSPDEDYVMDAFGVLMVPGTRIPAGAYRVPADKADAFATAHGGTVYTYLHVGRHVAQDNTDVTAYIGEPSVNFNDFDILVDASDANLEYLFVGAESFARADHYTTKVLYQTQVDVSTIYMNGVDPAGLTIHKVDDSFAPLSPGDVPAGLNFVTIDITGTNVNNGFARKVIDVDDARNRSETYTIVLQDANGKLKTATAAARLVCQTGTDYYLQLFVDPSDFGEEHVTEVVVNGVRTKQLSNYAKLYLVVLDTAENPPSTVQVSGFATSDPYYGQVSAIVAADYVGTATVGDDIIAGDKVLEFSRVISSDGLTINLGVPAHFVLACPSSVISATFKPKPLYTVSAVSSGITVYYNGTAQTLPFDTSDYGDIQLKGSYADLSSGYLTYQLGTFNCMLVWMTGNDYTVRYIKIVGYSQNGGAPVISGVIPVAEVKQADKPVS